MKCFFLCRCLSRNLFISLPPTTSLVEVLVQLGAEITSDPEAVKGLLERFGITEASPPRSDQVVEIISMLSRLAAEGTAICDVGSLIRAIVSYVSSALILCPFLDSSLSIRMFR